MKLFSLRRWVDNGGRRQHLERFWDKAWHSVRDHCSSRTPREDHVVGQSPLRVNSIHQSSCQTKSLDKEDANKKKRQQRKTKWDREEDRVGQSMREKEKFIIPRENLNLC